jgi:hypothetical protein
MNWCSNFHIPLTFIQLKKLTYLLKENQCQDSRHSHWHHYWNWGCSPLVTSVSPQKLNDQDLHQVQYVLTKSRKKYKTNSPLNILPYYKNLSCSQNVIFRQRLFMWTAYEVSNNGNLCITQTAWKYESYTSVKIKSQNHAELLFWFQRNYHYKFLATK